VVLIEFLPKLQRAYQLEHRAQALRPLQSTVGSMAYSTGLPDTTPETRGGKRYAEEVAGNGWKAQKRHSRTSR
jgi:hypothetical protein